MERLIKLNHDPALEFVYTMIRKNEQDKTTWIGNNIPLSNRFDDTYYTRTDGRGETDHVYIKGNNLPHQWANSTHCTIAELGFGTGLNFLETARQWNKKKTTNAILDFVSFEQFPLDADEIRRAISPWSELEELVGILCQNWQTDNDKFEMEFPGNIRLRVNFGDANILLPNHELFADAWYLDGFSPAKNPEMWNEKLMCEVYNSTRSGGTFATYTIAGVVRHNLQTAGFEIAREKGFGSKREMLTGHK